MFDKIEYELLIKQYMSKDEYKNLIYNDIVENGYNISML